MDKDTSSSPKIPEIELFIFGGLISQNKDDNALVHHFRQFGPVHFLIPSDSCLSNLSNLTSIQEGQLKDKINEIRDTTRSKLAELTTQLILEGRDIRGVRQYTSDDLFLLGMYDSTHSHNTVYQEILKKAIPLIY